ncbi:DsbA family protein [Chthonobacter albigriseus]|uniref:DsbA family protein n=1 Tax=Chthonobacter albigriseus TaxID=1683161 RepID=UPI0015EE726B
METPSPIEFWFDFSSGYAYFASLGAEALGERVGRRVLWRPYMLGAAFEVTGSQNLSSTPLKKDYAWKDWKRIASSLRVPFDPPSSHPATALAATRAFYWIEERAPDRASVFAASVFRVYYTGLLDTASPEAVAVHAEATVGVRAGDVLLGIADPNLKIRVREKSDEALSKGVFGSPFFIVDEEPFWGWDRMGMMERWISAGGW